MSLKYIGKAVSRVDGIKKVTGTAKFAAEFPTPDLLYGVVVSSEIAKGKIVSINDTEAMKVVGVKKIITHKNRPDIAWFNRKYNDQDAPHGEHFKALYDENIIYSQQPIALVVAETFEAARYASQLIKVDYSEDSFQTDMQIAKREAQKPKKGKGDWETPKSRGTAEKAFKEAPYHFEAEYTTPIEHHNPMEMHASTVIYHGPDKITAYDKTQGVLNSKEYICKVFNLDKDNVQVISQYVGGAFGSGLRPQYQLLLAVMAALDLKKSVRVQLTRQQMFSFGHRPETINNIKLSTDADGKLQSLSHRVIQETSKFEEYTENIVNWTGHAYQCDNVDLEHLVAHVDLYTPLDMRAPGAASGVYALESAMDEMAFKLHIDPIEFRLRNYAESDQMHHHRPYASKELKACYNEGAEIFGWQKRNPKPRSMKDGRKLIGWGMAGGLWEANRMPSKVSACINTEGKLTVSSAASDMGTGTYTIMCQIAADLFGLSIEQVEAKLGDSKLPEAPLSGGSWTAASISTGLVMACDKLKMSLLVLAKEEKNSPLGNTSFDDAAFREGWIFDKTDLRKKVSITALLENNNKSELSETDGENPILGKVKQMPFSKHTHSAVFVEVKVDEDLGMIEVSRVVSAVAAGKILNLKTAKSQILGGIVWGVSQALHEESKVDHHFGRIMNHTLAEYHIPVQKDFGELEVHFVKEHDEVTSKIGAKGIGEIGIVGTAAAVANAIFHATGKRIRDLPITPSKLL
jgi:xanthine dehydrogenase YagR molybdenum-binding subunit